jgi:hypothetical protein
MREIAIEILGASFFATHHASADDAVAGAEREFTAPAFPLLVGRARRFTSLVTQLHMEVIGSLPRRPGHEQPAAVFATCHGEIQTAQRLIADFREHAGVSSAQFAYSVHNTPSGLHAIATGNTAPATTITGENAIAAGWLEAALVARETGRPVVLSIADEPVPPAFRGPVEPGGVAAAFLVGPGGRSGDGLAAQLVFAAGDPAPDRPARLLARAASAVARRAAEEIALGNIRPGGALRLLVGGAAGDPAGDAAGDAGDAG